MVLQMEDCIDVVKNLWPQFDYVFLFDHSCGHDRRWPDGLTTKSLSKGFGGAQTNMRESKIEADNSDNMGPHARKLTLKLGDKQSMQFSSTNDGPCWMSPAQRLATKKDRPSVKTTSTDRLVQDLRKDLEGKGESSMGTKKLIQQRCIEQGIPFQIIIEQIRRKTTDRLALDLRKDLDAKGVIRGETRKSCRNVAWKLEYQFK
jgi:hypothetical protein